MTASDASPAANLLFVYGTLKRGHCRAPLLAGQRFLRAARTRPRYRLLNCGTFPGLVDAANQPGAAIEGELWEVDPSCLARLDREEGVDEGLYRRAAIEIDEVAGRVEAYLYLHDTATLADCGHCWTLELERRALGQ